MINYHCLHNKSTKYFSKTNSLLTPLALVLPFKFFIFWGYLGIKSLIRHSSFGSCLKKRKTFRLNELNLKTNT